MATGLFAALPWSPPGLAAETAAPGSALLAARTVDPRQAGGATPGQQKSGGLELRKLQAEIEKLQEEIRSLRVANEAIDPRSKWWFALLSAAGGLSGAGFAAVLLFLADRRLKASQRDRLQQERDLAREKHLLELYNGLGDESFRTRIASASVLLQRLSAHGQRQRAGSSAPLDEDDEIPTVINVLVSLMKDPPERPVAIPRRSGGARDCEPRSPAGVPQSALAARLGKYVADNLVKALGAVSEQAPAEGSASPLAPYDFQKVVLDDVFWRWIDARGVDFFGSSLTSSSLRDARLAGAILLEADLTGTTLQNADLSLADLRRADLRRADLRQVDLSGAKLEGAKLDDARLEGAIYDDDTQWPDREFRPRAHGLVRSRAALYADIMVRAYESGEVGPSELQRFAEGRAGRVDGLRGHALRTIGYVEARTNANFDHGRIARAEQMRQGWSAAASPRPIDAFTDAFRKPGLAALARDLMDATEAGVQGGAARMLTPAAVTWLAELCRARAPRRCVDLGTYTGLSALTLAATTEDGARVWTCDVDAKAVELARKFWERAGLAQKIDSEVMPASRFLENLVDELGAESVDLVLLDANFDQYSEYFEPISTLLAPGGLLLVDDPNWWGLQEPVMLAGDPGTRRLEEFLRELRARTDYEIVGERSGVELLAAERSKGGERRPSDDEAAPGRAS